jgi:hypothetical protein
VTFTSAPFEVPSAREGSFPKSNTVVRCGRAVPTFFAAALASLPGVISSTVGLGVNGSLIAGASFGVELAEIPAKRSSFPA